MTKAGHLPEAQYSISQVNALTGVPKTTIRFWEKEFNDFLQPMRTSGNQRRYGPGDVETIAKISHLVNNDGYTLDGVRRKMQNESELEQLPKDKPERKIENLAETMSEYLLKRIFAMAQAEEVSSRKVNNSLISEE